ncbi:MAG: hypothetical protein VYE22_32180 [Myxococcota bacterium]|nr:hypothetical protein [Myxococcota bacterium]
MGIASIALGVLALIFTFAGFLLTPIPFVGSLFSFGAPVCALIGIVLGGVSLSRARTDGSETGLPTAGLVVSVVAFFPAFFVALVCGVCNSVCSAASMAPRPPAGQQQPWWMTDAGAAGSPGLGPQPAAPPAQPPAQGAAPPGQPPVGQPSVPSITPVDPAPADPSVDPAAPPTDPGQFPPPPPP